MARRLDVVLDEMPLAISGIEDAVAGYSVASFAGELAPPKRH